MMSGPFDDPLDFTSIARKILEQDRLMRETLGSVGGHGQLPRSLEIIEQQRAIERFIGGFGGPEGLRDYMARAAEAQRTFTTAFPPERLAQFQAGFTSQAVITASAGRALALQAQTSGSMPNVFARLQAIPDLATLINQGVAGRQADLKAAIAAGSRLDAAWASVASPSVSIGALAELSAFTARIRSSTATSDERALEVAQQFGDYDAAFADAETADSEEEREAVYSERGRNPVLVAFPSPAYPSVLVAAGWVPDFVPPPPPLLVTGDACEVAFHDPADNATITAVEAHLRHYVDATLRRRFGDGWIHTLVPADKAAGWNFRQQASVAKGNPAFTLIHYADFQDLLDIIGRKGPVEGRLRRDFRP